MLLLTRLAPLLASFAAMDVGQFISRMRRNAVIYALVLLFSLTAYGALVAAAAVAMAEEIGAAGALLVVAGAAVLLALVLLLVVRMRARAEERKRKQAAIDGGSRALMATAALSVLPVVVKSRSLAILAVAGGLGYLAMRNMDSITGRSHRPRPGPRPEDDYRY
ncbi:heme/copper-type cytochrome/quinol oxidase subunit 2 [Pseudorhizobium tarimense]|uniref:Heme/copper-type cytochrome/quinol oxidase subunit 2 n=1 Tax=Pseudorhizobium tarimense TaxID=1079109 RepID=A0ABV2HDH3_9HYPH|nr:hypothetical protein [Pseudorhizobium tarimense]MCJ8521570.1 hypothetical protein [Pseudorhizobium tarimense]